MLPGITFKKLSEAGVAEARLWNTDQEWQAYILRVRSTHPLMIGPVGSLTHSEKKKDIEKLLDLKKHIFHKIPNRSRIQVS